MASSWKKIFEKINALPPEAPFASDWETMNQKIEAHPALNHASQRGGIWWKVSLVVVLLALLGMGLFIVSPLGVQKSVTNKNSKPPVEKQLDKKGPDGEYADPRQELDHNKKNEQITAREESGTRNEGIRDVKEGTEQKVTKKDQPRKEQNLTDHIETKEAPKINRDIVNAEEKITTDNTRKNTDAENEASSMNETYPSSASEVKHTEQIVNLANRDWIFTLQDLDKITLEEGQKENPELAIKEAEKGPSNNLYNSGFRVSALSVGAGYQTNYTNGFNGYGSGLDVELQRKGLLLNAGLYFYQIDKSITREQQETKQWIDTTYKTHIDTRVETHKDSTWIISGPFSGGYVYNTYQLIFNDTIRESRIDTNKILYTKQVEQKIRLSYVEMPILAGHRFRFNRFEVDLKGGVVLNKLTQGDLEGTQIEKAFGMDAIIQPALQYYFLPEWSVFGKASLRYGLLADQQRPSHLYNGFQIGVSYYW